MIDKITRFVYSLKKRIKSDFTDVDETTYQKRLAVCELCPNKTENWQCSLCGCFLAIKARWSTEDCPLGKWSLPVILPESSDKKACCKK